MESDEQSRRLRRLEDRQEIDALIQRYCVAVDGRDAGQLRSCFTTDVYTEYGGEVLGRGVDIAVDYIWGVAQFHVSSHYMLRSLIELDGDAAHGTTYAIATLIGTDENPGFHLTRGLQYHDAFARTDGQWRIGRRIQATDWTRDADGIRVGR